jgi:hypothetical protein
MALAVATIVGRNYLPHARVLADSFRRFHDDVPLFVLLVDDRHFTAAKERFEVLQPELLAIPALEQLRASSTIQELAVVCKPFVLRWLLDQSFDRVLFLDPDMLVLGDLTPLFERLQRHAIVLTPHLTEPPRGARRFERQRNIAQAGIFNGGVVGVSEREAARSFLSWWCERVRHACRSDVAAGLYYDQRWLDLAPIFFDDVSILRDPGYNVAYWNLPERELELRGDDVVTVTGAPCRLLHFSGYDRSNPQFVTRYLPQLRLAELGAAAKLFERYAAMLAAAEER